MKIPLEVRENGLYCPEGDFYIDAWNPVPTCLITHAHSDHAKQGHGYYICSEKSLELLKYRLGEQIKISSYPFQKKFKLKNTWISFHSAGHILGSSQIRIELKDTICVISGDYKRAFDLSCDPFDLVKCDIFVTESTFGLPIYKWDPSEIIAQQIYNWWQENKTLGFSSVLFGYSLGKSQRIQSLLTPFTTQPLYAHGSIIPISNIYSKFNVPMLPLLSIKENEKKRFTEELILAPPMAQGSLWLKRFFPYKLGFASGWMLIRGTRKRKNIDRGFPLSDHADWPDLLKTIQETGASTILTTHGNALNFARFLREHGIKAEPLKGTEIFDEGEE